MWGISLVKTWQHDITNVQHQFQKKQSTLEVVTLVMSGLGHYDPETSCRNYGFGGYENTEPGTA